MNTTRTATLQFDPINMSSLKSVLTIYHNKMSSKADFEIRSSEVTSNLGLPLSIASFENKVIGYAFVVINKMGDPEINSYWEKDHYTIEVEKDLKFHAQSTFLATFHDTETRTIKIQNATERLHNWLNFCN